MRIDGQNDDERCVRLREEHVNGIQHHQHFVLLAAVQAVHNDHQPCLLLCERIQTFYLIQKHQLTLHQSQHEYTKQYKKELCISCCVTNQTHYSLFRHNSIKCHFIYGIYFFRKNNITHTYKSVLKKISSFFF